MKRAIYIIILSCIFISCNKEDENNSRIIGGWRWYKTDIIYSGGVATPQSTSKTWNLKFTGDYNCLQSGDLYSPANGNYSVSRLDNYDHITMNFPDSSQQYYFDFAGNDTLHLGSGPVADGAQHYFVRF